MSSSSDSTKRFISQIPSSNVLPYLAAVPSDTAQVNQPFRILSLFQDIASGRNHPRNPWTVFHLTVVEYHKLQHLISSNTSLRGFVEDKIRYDYDAYREQLVVRMPTGLHEIVNRGLDHDIKCQIDDIKNGKDRAAEFAKKLRSSGSADIFLPLNDENDKDSRRSPDSSFTHTCEKFPGVIVEISYSQRRKNLAKLADDYLLFSDGCTQVVVGLDLEYTSQNSKTAAKGSKEAALFIWRLGKEDNVVQTFLQNTEKIFRDAEGNPTGHPGLRLQLRDFATESTTEKVLGSENREVVISATRLCEILAEAEDLNDNGPKNRVGFIGPNDNIRQRSATPPDLITADDEEKYLEAEQREEDLADQMDLDYQP